MCPNRSHAEWMQLKSKHAAMKANGSNQHTDWEKAIEFEEEIRRRDDAAWLTQTGMPLAELPEHPDQPDLMTSRCDSGHCFV